jgi:glutamyl-tRNA reductase
MYLANARVTHSVAGPEAVAEAVARAEPERIAQALRSEGFDEVAVLTTCNRFEVYGAGLGDLSDAGRRIATALEKAISPEKPARQREAAPRIEVDSGPVAGAHLLRVSTSIESMVVGETEILNQVKDAYQRARARGDIGPVLSTVFLKALRAGRIARAETGIGEGKTSIPALAVDSVRELLKDARVLVIGAGSVAGTIHRQLEGAGAAQVVLANRTPAKLKAAASKLRARVAPWAKLDEEIALADVVLSAVASKKPVLEAKWFDGWHGTLVDLGVPPNASPAVVKLCRVGYIGMSRLEKAAAANRERRKAEAAKVERLLDAEIASLEKDLETVGSEGFAAVIMKYAEEIRQREVERASKLLGGAPDQSVQDWAAHQRAVEVMDMLTRSIVKKLTFHPIQAIKGGRLSRSEADRFIELFTGEGDVSHHEAKAPARDRRD